MRATAPSTNPSHRLLGLALLFLQSSCHVLPAAHSAPPAGSAGELVPVIEAGTDVRDAAPQSTGDPVASALAHAVEDALRPEAALPAAPAAFEAPAPETGDAADLWARLRDSFRLDHALSQRQVQQELRWLKRHSSYLPRLQQRLQRYLPHIHAEVVARGMPGELALLPIVESALDPYAFSHGGAAGLWQFIPTTASRFGLPRNWWIDGRRDPVLATEAALTYLQYLHNRFDDWYLAVAGYNAGEGNVHRALRRAQGARSFWDLSLPRETRAYVPRLLALAAVVADPGRHGLTLPALEPTPGFITVDTHSQFDLARAAAALDVDVALLYEWNPALNQWATPPDGPHHLHVPASLGERAQARLSEVPAAERVQWLRVEVRRGDTLSHIARRHRTDVATLRRVNRLQGSRIRAGQALFVPQADAALQVAPPALGPGRGTGKDYRVKSGDSLWTIARRHGVSVDALVKANRVGPKEVLRIGQRLVIPGERTAAGRGAVVRTVRYGVRRGDSLAKIAGKFNVAVADLARWNELDIKRFLQPGQQLTIHVNVAAAD